MATENVQDSVSSTKEAEGALNDSQKVKYCSEETIESRNVPKSLQVADLEKLCSFDDDEFDFLSLKERVERLSGVREWFYERYGDTAAEKSGFIHGISVEARLLTFLIARNFDEEAAEAMIEKHVTWLAKYNIYEIDVHVHCPTAYKSGTWRIAGADKEGVPIIWIQAALWRPKEYYSVDEYIYYIGWMIENARRLSMNNSTQNMEKVNMLFDMEGFSMFTCDMECIRKLIATLLDHFPEALKRAFVINTNIAFQAMMKLINYLLSKRTSRKMVILGSGASMKETLLSWIPREVLPVKYGGICETDYPIGSDQYIKQVHMSSNDLGAVH